MLVVGGSRSTMVSGSILHAGARWLGATPTPANGDGDKQWQGKGMPTRSEHWPGLNSVLLAQGPKKDADHCSKKVNKDNPGHSCILNIIGDVCGGLGGAHAPLESAGAPPDSEHSEW